VHNDCSGVGSFPITNWKGQEVKITDGHKIQNEKQAIKWAQRSLDGGEVLKFRVTKSEIENLNGLIFSEGSSAWENFVRSNRQGSPLHDYDFVDGPMLLNRPRNFLKGEPPINGGHQMSFHSEDAVQMLMKYLQK